MFTVTVLVVCAAILTIALPRLRVYHPYPSFGPANATTAIRAVLAAVVCGLACETPTPAVAVGAVAAATAATVLDGVDGWLARRTKMASAFGARFDMEVDALLILALSILAWRHDKAGVWVLASGLLRYAWVAAGRMLPWLARPLTPTRRGRAICVIQVVVLLVVMLPSVVPPASTALATGGVLVLVYSFAVDTMRLWRYR